MFTVGYLQFFPVRFNVETNIKTIRDLLSGIKADLLVLPELSNSGYLYTDPEDIFPYSENGDGSGPFLSALNDLAKETNGVIVTGFAERTQKGLYNSAAAISADGVMKIYRKIHLFADEPTLFLPGDRGFQVFEYRSVRIGMMICFDWIFPEAARTLALMNAQIIAHPANLILPFCQRAMVTRSLENGVFSITTNRYGMEQTTQRKLTFTGGSQILDEKGTLLLQAPIEGDCVNLCDIDPLNAENKMITGRNHLLIDRRPDKYNLCT